jgi:hypothetical protein
LLLCKKIINFRRKLLSLENELRLEEPPEDLYLLCPNFLPTDPTESKDFRTLEGNLELKASLTCCLA